ncbi:MAG TPA: hypothetical protein VN310_04560 [Candidatus Dormibacteraeota bacterium]|jgi:hypothetical protein|nr:hypothetical protein [Candidatus Dormibacteraeota bacterium]
MQSFPNRCQHLKINGTQCGSPALRRNRFCFFHKRFQDEQIKLSADRARRGVATFVLPVLEDANSIQIALMQVMRLLVSQQIEHKTASLLLYALQTASTNLRMTNFKPFIHEVVLDPRTVNDTPLDANLWEDEDFEEEQEEEETEADRKIAALETVRKKKEEDAKWMKWAEAQYPNPTPKPSPQPNPQSHPQQTPPQKQLKPDHSSASVTEASAAEVAPASAPKKPASGLNPTEVRRQISEQIRKAFPEGYASIGGSKGDSKSPG